MIAQRLLRPDLAAIEVYQPIVPFEVLAERLGRPIGDIVKLDANENPYGPPPGALAALAAGRHYHIYPDPDANGLRPVSYTHLDVYKRQSPASSIWTRARWPSWPRRRPYWPRRRG